MCYYLGLHVVLVKNLNLAKGTDRGLAIAKCTRPTHVTHDAPSFCRGDIVSSAPNE